MRTLRIIGAFLLGLALMLAPVSAAQAAPGGDGQPTDVVITKVKLTDLTGWPKDNINDDGTRTDTIVGADGTTAYNGGQITNMQGFFGTTDVVPGVTFKVYSVTAADYATLMGNPAGHDTVAEMATLGYADPGAAGTRVTGANGQVRFDDLANGYYWFIEDLTVDGSPMVNAGAAVPFGLQLPLLRKDGSYFGTDADALYVYPKNTLGDVPTVDKDVTELGNDSDSANVGAPVEWIIKPTLPADISSYRVLKFTDALDSRLDFVPGSVVVTLNGTTVDAANYTLTAPASASGGTLVVDFATTFLATLTGTSDLQVKFQTLINGTAALGTPIPNGVSLDFTNGSGVVGTPATVPPEDQPEVWAGGKKFMKVQEGNTSAIVPGAVFALYNDLVTDTQVVWTAAMVAMNRAAIDAGTFATLDGGVYTATSGATTVEALVGTPVHVRSGADGTFEIQGLQGYEPTSGEPATVGDKVNTVSHPGTYLLREVFAPAGYALRTADFTFTVTKTSYTSTSVEYFVENKVITIPPTGGIGTIVFTVAGLALMGGAVFGLRRRGTKA